MAQWRVANALQVLLGQLNAMYPNRSKASDGSIGDEAHQEQGNASDHNPWYGPGIVTARDFTHDPVNGIDCNELAQWLVGSRDPRIKYIIWQGRICDSRAQFRPWTWQPSSGHYQHLHLSVMNNSTCDSGDEWELGDDMALSEEDMRRAVRNGVQDALHFRYAEGRNIADDIKQQTASALDTGADGDKILAEQKRTNELLTQLVTVLGGTNRK